MLLAGLTGLALAVAAPVEGGAPGDPCAIASACRHVDSVRVENTDGKEVVLPVDQDLPWVTQGNLLLLPGDWIVVRLESGVDGLSPVLVRAGHGGKAAEPADGEIAVHVNEYQAGTMIVQLSSRYPVALDYAAVMVTPKGPQRTSVCTLIPGAASFESWQRPIRQFAFWSFRPATEPGCRIIEFPTQEKG